MSLLLSTSKVSNSAEKGSGTAHALPVPAQNMVVLKMDGLQLILSQIEVCSVESISDVNYGGDLPRATGALSGVSSGTIAVLGGTWPVYCFSQELDLLQYLPRDRRACVMLAIDGAYLGIACDDARVLSNFAPLRFDVPASMRTAGSPITGLIQFENGLACVSDAVHLNAFARLMASNHPREVH